MTPLERARRLVAESLDRDLEEVSGDGTMESVPGWDSLGHVRIILALEASLGRALSGAEIASIGSLTDVAALLSTLPTD